MRKRKLYLELLRVFCIVLVMFNHTGTKGFLLFTERMESKGYFVFMAASFLCKMAVPLFYMISGALLLQTVESIRTLYTKRVLRMIVVLLIASVPYYLWLHKDSGMSVAAFLSFVYAHSATTALWYLYSYIGLLLMLPLLRRLAQAMTTNDYVYLSWSYVILTGILPMVEYIIWKGENTLNSSFSAPQLSSAPIYYVLMGHYFENLLDLEKVDRKRLLIGGIGVFAAVILTCTLTHFKATIQGGYPAGEAETFLNSLIMIPTCFVFLLAKKSEGFISGSKMGRILCTLGSSVFGVYLLERILRQITGWVYDLAVPVTGSFIASLLWCFVGVGIGLAIVTSMKCIPYVKRLINYFI